MSSSPSPPSQITILVADDHAVVRAGVRSLLQKQADITVVAEAASAEELLERAVEHRPRVVVADLRMPGEGVLDAVRTLRVRQPATEVVIFSAFDEPADALDALDAGAAGYVLKQGAETDLITAVRRAALGKRFVEPSLAARVLEERPALDAQGGRAGRDGLTEGAVLSEREAEVLDLVARGFTGPQIAVELGVRVGTIETLRHRIRKKLGLQSRADFTRFARSSRFRRMRGR